MLEGRELQGQVGRDAHRPPTRGEAKERDHQDFHMREERKRKMRRRWKSQGWGEARGEVGGLGFPAVDKKRELSLPSTGEGTGGKRIEKLGGKEGGEVRRPARKEIAR